MNRTSIEWTDFTSNPLKFRNAAGEVVWGCVHASPGCQHCYAETLAKRYGRGGPFNVPTMAGLTPFLDEAELRRMLTYKPAAGKRCFCGDMTDVFGPWVPDALLDRLFAVFALRHDVTWQVLTKRVDRLRAYFEPLPFRAEMIGIEAERISGSDRHTEQCGPRWTLPHPNVWLGVSVEDQQRADERIPALLQTPAAMRFISAEPLLGPIDLHLEWLSPFQETDARLSRTPRLDWVIVGGESGSTARPCDLRWIERIVSDCEDAEVAIFVKQVGSVPLDWSKAETTGRFRTNPETGRRELEVKQARLRDRKGGDMAEWPFALRVRQFPGQVVLA